jgi:hypothetical protein
MRATLAVVEGSVLTALGGYRVLTAQPTWLEQADVESEVHGVGVPVHTETPVLQAQPLD